MDVERTLDLEAHHYGCESTHLLQGIWNLTILAPEEAFSQNNYLNWPFKEKSFKKQQRETTLIHRHIHVDKLFPPPSKEPPRQRLRVTSLESTWLSSIRSSFSRYRTVNACTSDKSPGKAEGLLRFCSGEVPGKAYTTPWCTKP